MDNRFTSGKPSKTRKWLFASLCAFSFAAAAVASNQTEAIPAWAEEAVSDIESGQSGPTTSSSGSASTTHIYGEQTTEVSDPVEGSGIPEDATDVGESMIVSLKSSTSTPTMQSYNVDFSSKISTIANRYRQTYVTVNDPSFAGDVEAPADEEGKVELPEYTGAVYQIEIASGGPAKDDTAIEMPSQLTKAGFYVVNINSILPDAVNPESAPSITEIYIPSEIVLAAEGALTGLSESCQIYFEADAVPETFEPGWTDVPEANWHFGTELDYQKAMNSSQNKDFGTGKSFVIGYDAGDDAPIGKQLLRMTYDVIDEDGNRTTYHRDYPINYSTVNVFYNAVGDTVGQTSLSRYIDIPKNPGETIDDESIIFSNIYPATTCEHGRIAPDFSQGSYYASARLSYTNKYDLSDFADLEFDHLSTFSGYTAVMFNAEVKNQVYETLNPTIFASQSQEIESGQCYIRFRFSSLNAMTYVVEYEKDGEMVESSISVKTPIANFVVQRDKAVGFILKNSDVGDGFNAKSMRSISLLGMSITVDVMNNETHQAIGHSSISTRFGTIEFDTTDEQTGFPTFDINSTLITIVIVYTAVMAVLTIAYFLYKKVRFKNDEFRRLNPKSFAINASLAYVLIGSIMMFLVFCIMRWTHFANTIVVYNPFDPYVIVFGVIAILATGYYIRFLYLAIKNDLARRKAIKLKLDSDVKDDDGTK